MLRSPGPVIIDFGVSFLKPLNWYGLLTISGFFIAFLVGYSLIKKRTDKTELLFDWACVTFLSGLIGARTWFVILDIKRLWGDPLEMLAIWHGGQSIQGAFIGGIIGGLIFYKLNKEKLPPWWLACDCVAVVLPLAQAIGRWGNFFNTEAFGSPTNLPWGLFVPLEKRPLEYLGFESFHPTFAYESILLILIFLFLYYLFSLDKLRGRGIIFCSYFMIYSFIRFFLEFLRTDSLFLFGFPAAQVICIVTFIFSLGVLFLLSRKDKENGKEEKI